MSLSLDRGAHLPHMPKLKAVSWVRQGLVKAGNGDLNILLFNDLLVKRVAFAIVKTEQVSSCGKTRNINGVKTLFKFEINHLSAGKIKDLSYRILIDTFAIIGNIYYVACGICPDGNILFNFCYHHDFYGRITDLFLVDIGMF